MGKSYADYGANRSNSYHLDKNRANYKHDRSDTPASRSQLRRDVQRDQDLNGDTVSERKWNDRMGGWRATSYHEPSRRPPKLKAIYHENGHDLNSLTLDEVEQIMGDRTNSAGLSYCLNQFCPVRFARNQEVERTHQILTKQVERRGKVAPFKTKPKEKREFSCE